MGKELGAVGLMVGEPLSQAVGEQLEQFVVVLAGAAALPRRLARDYLPNDSVIPHFEIETGSRHPASPCRPFPVSLHLGTRRSAPAFLKSEIHNGKSPLRQQRPPLRYRLMQQPPCGICLIREICAIRGCTRTRTSTTFNRSFPWWIDNPVTL